MNLEIDARRLRKRVAELEATLANDRDRDDLAWFVARFGTRAQIEAGDATKAVA